MRLVGLVGAAALILVLGTTVPAYCDRGEKGDRQGKHESKAERDKPGKVEKHEVRHAPQSPRHVRSRPEHRVVWQQRRAGNWVREHRTWKQRGGYRGYRIPHDRYIVYFGPQHRFRVHTLPVLVVAGHPRFQYHGFWFSLVDPWPEYWAANWYETDDVYVEYVHDGYYMYNARHPGVAISIGVSL